MTIFCPKYCISRIKITDVPVDSTSASCRCENVNHLRRMRSILLIECAGTRSFTVRLLPLQPVQPQQRLRFAD